MDITLKSIKDRIHTLNGNLDSRERGTLISKIFPDLAKEILDEAEYAMQDLLVLPGTGPERYFVGKPPKWTENPCGDNEYTFFLNRFANLKTLSEAYSLTGDQRYAKKALSELEDWIETVKRPQICNENNEILPLSFDGCTPWRALEVGIRCYRTLPFVIELTIDSELFTQKLLDKIIGSLKEHMEVLYTVSPLLWPKADHNHYLMENLGLLTVSLMFPELDPEKRMFLHANHEIDRCMEAQCTEFGGQIEGCPSYHNGCVYWFSLRNQLAMKYGFTIPQKYTDNLEKMVIHSIIATRACGGNFPWGDSHTSETETLSRASVGYYLATGNSKYIRNALYFYPKHTLQSDIKDCLWRFHDLNKLRKDYLFALENPLEPDVPKVFWDKALKQVFYKSDSTHNAISLMTGCRVPIQNLHAHMDPGGFDLTAFGSPIISDPGIYTYKNDENRHHFKSTCWHNCATINGQDAWEYKGSWAYGPQGEGDIIDVVSNEDYTSILSSHNSYSPAILTRNIIIADNIILVLDKASGLEDGKNLKVFLHLNFDALSIEDRNSIHAESDGVFLRVRNLIGSSKLDIYSGKISTANDVWHDSMRVAFTSDEKDAALLITAIEIKKTKEEQKNNITCNVIGNCISIALNSRTISVDRNTLKIQGEN